MNIYIDVSTIFSLPPPNPQWYKRTKIIIKKSIATVKHFLQRISWKDRNDGLGRPCHYKTIKINGIVKLEQDTWKINLHSERGPKKYTIWPLLLRFLGDLQNYQNYPKLLQNYPRWKEMRGLLRTTAVNLVSSERHYKLFCMIATTLETMENIFQWCPMNFTAGANK